MMDVISALQALISALGGEWFIHATTTAPAQFATFVFVIALASFMFGYSIKNKQLKDKESQLEKTKTVLDSKQAEIDLINQEHKTELSELALQQAKELNKLQDHNQQLESDLIAANSAAKISMEKAREKYNSDIAIEKIRIENENKLKEENRLREEQRKKEKLKQLAKQDELDQVDAFKRMDYDAKALIAKAFFLGEFVATEGSFEYLFGYVDPLDYLSYETKYDGEHYTLNTRTKELLNNHPELVSQFDKEMFE